MFRIPEQEGSFIEREKLFRALAESGGDFYRGFPRQLPLAVFIRGKNRLADPRFFRELLLRQFMLQAVSLQQIARRGLLPEFRLKRIAHLQNRRDFRDKTLDGIETPGLAGALGINNTVKFIMRLQIKPEPCRCPKKFT